MKTNQTTKIITYLTLLLNLVMFVTALSLAVMIFVTSDDPTKRLSSHFATMALTLLPTILHFSLKNKLNLFLYVFAALYVFIAVFLGSSLNFYNTYGNLNYDKIVHVFFGYSSALVGLYILLQTKKLNSSSLFFNLLFLFSFALMISAVWEIFEFSSDRFFGTVTQGDPLDVIGGGSATDVGETMFDIIANFIGAIIFMIQYTFHHKTKKAPIMNFMINELSK